MPPHRGECVWCVTRKAAACELNARVVGMKPSTSARLKCRHGRHTANPAKRACARQNSRRVMSGRSAADRQPRGSGSFVCRSRKQQDAKRQARVACGAWRSRVSGARRQASAIAVLMLSWVRPGGKGVARIGHHPGGPVGGQRRRQVG